MALTESEAVTVAETAVTVAQVAAKMTRRPVELAPEPVHEDVTWVSAYDVNPLDVPLAEKTGLFAGLDPASCSAPTASTTPRGSLQQVQENKYYADLGGSSITQQRVRLEPHLEVHGTDPSDRRLRLDAHDRPAGRPRLGVPHRRRLRLRRRARPAPRAARARSSPRRACTPASTTW